MEGNVALSLLPGKFETLCELVAQTQELNGDVRGTIHSQLHQLGKAFALLLVVVVSVVGQEDESRKQGNIGSRHLLTREDDARVHPGLFAFLVFVHVHAATPNACPEVFQPLNLLGVDAVLVFVDMDESVADAGHSIGQCRNGGRLNVLRVVAHDEECHHRLGQFGLTRTLRAEDVEDRERSGLLLIDILEERSDIETEADNRIVAEHIDNLGEIVVQRDIGIGLVTELALVGIQFRRILIYLGHGGKIVVAFLQPDNALVIYRMPDAILQGTIAETVEALLLPAELLDFHCGL